MTGGIHADDEEEEVFLMVQPTPPTGDEMTLRVYKEQIRNSIVEYNDFIKKYTTELSALTRLLPGVAQRGDAEAVQELAHAADLSEHTRHAVLQDLATYLIQERAAPDDARIDNWDELLSEPGVSRWISEHNDAEVRAWANALFGEASAVVTWATMKGTTPPPSLQSAWLVDVREAVSPAIDEMNSLFVLLPEIDQRLRELLSIAATTPEPSKRRGARLPRLGGPSRVKPMTAQDVPNRLADFWADQRSRVPTKKLNNKSPIQRFSEFLGKNFAKENLDFIMLFFESDATTRKTSFPSTMQEVQGIYDTFITNDSDTQVNIDSNLTNRLQNALKGRDLPAARKALDEAFTNIWNLVENDQYRPFRNELRQQLG